jgi:hypothetical protein
VGCGQAFCYRSQHCFRSQEAPVPDQTQLEPRTHKIQDIRIPSREEGAVVMRASAVVLLAVVSQAAAFSPATFIPTIRRYNVETSLTAMSLGHGRGEARAPASRRISPAAPLSPARSPSPPSAPWHPESHCPTVGDRRGQVPPFPLSLARSYPKRPCPTSPPVPPHPHALFCASPHTHRKPTHAYARARDGPNHSTYLIPMPPAVHVDGHEQLHQIPPHANQSLAPPPSFVSSPQDPPIATLIPIETLCRLPRVQRWLLLQPPHLSSVRRPLPPLPFPLSPWKTPFSSSHPLQILSPPSLPYQSLPDFSGGSQSNSSMSSRGIDYRTSLVPLRP